MALPRLRNLVRAYVLDSLREQDEFKPERYVPNEMLLAAPSYSDQPVKKAYVHNKALTVFIKGSEPSSVEFSNEALTLESLLGDEAYSILGGTQHCFKNGFRFVRRNDADHDSVHQSSADFHEEHTHILKNAKAPHQLLSLAELRCMLKDIKEFEASYGLCKDGKAECILTNVDMKKIEDNFAEYTRVSKLKMPDIDAAADAICEELESRCRFGAKTFTQVFLATLLDKYFKPYLIDKFNDPQKANIAVDIIKTGVTFTLVESLYNAALSIIISTGLKVSLTAYGLEEDQVNIIVNRVAAVLAFTENPLSLVDIGLNDTAAEVGQQAAFAVIHLLPKLRAEPEIEEPVRREDQLAIVPVVEGLRRRSPVKLND